MIIEARGRQMIIEAISVPAKETKFFARTRENNEEVARSFIVVARNGLHKSPFALLEDVSVAPGYREMGIGGSFVDRVIDEARAENCYKLISTVRFDRSNLFAWYAKKGFMPWGIEFRMNLEP